MSELQTTDASILRAAMGLIDTPEKWTQHEYARDAKGRGVRWNGDDVACRCSTGAVWAVSPIGTRSQAMDYLRAEMGGNIVSFNDSLFRTHVEILAAFDRAISRAEASGK